MGIPPTETRQYEGGSHDDEVDSQSLEKEMMTSKRDALCHPDQHSTKTHVNDDDDDDTLRLTATPTTLRRSNVRIYAIHPGAVHVSGMMTQPQHEQARQTQQVPPNHDDDFETTSVPVSSMQQQQPEQQHEHAIVNAELVHEALVYPPQTDLECQSTLETIPMEAAIIVHAVAEPKIGLRDFLRNRAVIAFLTVFTLAFLGFVVGYVILDETLHIL